MILGRDMFTASVSNQKLSEHIIKADVGPLKELILPVVDFSTYKFKDLNTGEVTPEESFMNSYVDKIYESERVCASTK